MRLKFALIQPSPQKNANKHTKDTLYLIKWNKEFGVKVSPL